MTTTILILASVLATSVLSGVLGMAGGIILMAILIAVMSVSGAMVVHGIVQGTANGSRAFFLRGHIVWRVMPFYVAGAAVLENLHRFVLYTLATSTWGWDTGRAITNVVAVLLVGRAVLMTLRRATRKAAFDAPVSFGS